MEAASALEAAGVMAPELTVDVVFTARVRLKVGSAGGTDGVVTEMLVELPPSCVYRFHELFHRRYNSARCEETVEAWADMFLIFINKEIDSSHMQDFRCVLLLNACLKWYCNCSVILVESLVAPAKYNCTMAFGFSEGMACCQVTEALRIILSKA